MGIFKAHQVGAVINLESGGDRFAHHYGIAAQAQAQEDIGIPRRGLGGALLLLLLGAALAGGGTGGVGVSIYHLDGDGFGANLRSLHFGHGRRKGESAGFPGLQDVGVRSLGRAGGFPVHHLDAGGRALLRAPDQGKIRTGFPLEVRGCMFPFHNKYQVEPLLQFYDIVHFHPDAGLGPGHQGG